MLCLYRVLGEESYEVSHLLTTANSYYRRSSQHGIRMELMERQAQRLQHPLHTVWLPRQPSMKTYADTMKDAFRRLRDQGVKTVLYGDIFLEDLRAYRERQLNEVDLQVGFPLWQEPTDELALAFIDAGFRAIVVCVEEQLGREYVGRPFDRAFLRSLPEGVDPCGERGEFHTFVYDGPLFAHPVSVKRGEVVHRTYEPSGSSVKDSSTPSDSGTGSSETGFWYCDLIPAEEGGDL